MPDLDARRDGYWARINRAIDFVEAHLAEPLTLAEVATAAWFSPFHFHRLFRSLVGETLSDFVQRLRVERAAGQLRAHPRRSVTRIALECGYTSPAAFARAFCAAYGMSASQWRRGEPSKIGKAEGKRGKDALRLPGYPSAAVRETARETLARRMTMDAVTQPLDVRVEQMPPMEVAYVRHIGPYQGNAELFRGLCGRLMAWAGPRGLLRFPETQLLFVYHDAPEITEPEKLRTSVCITVPPETAGSGEVGRMTLPGGRYARARFELASDEYQQAWDAVYGSWLPTSGYEPDERPCFELYLNNPDEHPQHKAIVEICIPVRVA